MTDLDYRTLQHAIPTLDMILTAALHDRRVGWSDRAVYSAVCDAVAASQAPYKVQRVCLSLLRNDLGIPDSIEDARSGRTQNAPNQRQGAPPRDERGASGIRHHWRRHRALQRRLHGRRRNDCTNGRCYNGQTRRCPREWWNTPRARHRRGSSHVR